MTATVYLSGQRSPDADKVWLTVREAASRLRVSKTALYEALRLAAAGNMPTTASNG